MDGIERFSGLVEMELFEGETGAGFGLEALGQLKKLKSASLLSYGHLNVSPMSTCVQLRSLNVTATTLSGLESLKRLPVLHEVQIDKRTKQLAETEASVPDDLSSWDTEFAAEVPRPSPNFEVEIVSQREFDRYDSKVAFGIDPKEPEDGLLHHERDWLIEKIENALRNYLTPDEDFVAPVPNRDARSLSIAIFSLKAYESVRSIVAAIQAQLCSSKKDWIIYFQALPDEGPDADDLPKNAKNFTAWIYPDKIVATKTDAAVISRLLVP